MIGLGGVTIRRVFPEFGSGWYRGFGAWCSECQLIAKFYRDVQPPSMINVWPVISDAACEAKNVTAPDTSSGLPMR